MSSIDVFVWLILRDAPRSFKNTFDIPAPEGEITPECREVVMMRLHQMAVAVELWKRPQERFEEGSPSYMGVCTRANFYETEFFAAIFLANTFGANVSSSYRDHLSIPR